MFHSLGQRRARRRTRESDPRIDSETTLPARALRCAQGAGGESRGGDHPRTSASSPSAGVSRSSAYVFATCACSPIVARDFRVRGAATLPHQGSIEEIARRKVCKIESRNRLPCFAHSCISHASSAWRPAIFLASRKTHDAGGAGSRLAYHCTSGVRSWRWSIGFRQTARRS